MMVQNSAYFAEFIFADYPLGVNYVEMIFADLMQGQSTSFWEAYYYR